jgi:hypothetical protein
VVDARREPQPGFLPGEDLQRRRRRLCGATLRARQQQAAYVIARPVFGLLRRWAPDRVTTSVKVGRAMLAAAKRGAPASLVEVPGINALAG